MKLAALFQHLLSMPFDVIGIMDARQRRAVKQPGEDRFAVFEPHGGQVELVEMQEVENEVVELLAAVPKCVLEILKIGGPVSPDLDDLAVQDRGLDGQ